MSENNKQDESSLDDEYEEAQEQKYLMCKLGSETYGINITCVTDIIELQKVTEVPDMPEYVCGVINLRGHVIPVIDLRIRFNMEHREYDDRTVITVVEIRNTSIGFIVDTATEVQEIPDQHIDPPPRFENEEEKGKYISGLGKIDDQVIILLDVEELITKKDTEAILALS